MAVKISGDYSECTRCGTTWDTNDPHPPKHCEGVQEREYAVTYDGVPMGRYIGGSSAEAILGALAAQRSRTGPRLTIDRCKAELVDGPGKRGYR